MKKHDLMPIYPLLLLQMKIRTVLTKCKLSYIYDTGLNKILYVYLKVWKQMPSI